MSQQNRQIVIIKVKNTPGVLSKVSSLCRRRRYNIQSLTVGETHQPAISQITLVFTKEKERIQNIINQIDKLIEVLSVEVVEPKDVVDKELVLLIVKNNSVADKILEKKIHNISARIINSVDDCPVLEILGSGVEIENILESLNFKKDVIKMARSGLIALKL